MATSILRYVHVLVRTCDLDTLKFLHVQFLLCMDLLVSVAIRILHRCFYHFSSHRVLCESYNVNVRESLFVKSSVIHGQLPAGGTPAQESRSDYHN